MKAHVLRGSKQEIAEGVARIDGNVREAIVLVEEPSDMLPPSASTAPPQPGEDIFAEMEPYMVKGPPADYSRESIYSRLEGE